MERRTFLSASSAALLTACSGPADEPTGATTVGVSPQTAVGEAPLRTSTATGTPQRPATAAYSSGIAVAPFAVGVGSGDPGPERVTLWTRLAATDPGPFGSADETVEWELASDPEFTEVLQAGTASALAAHHHCVRVTVVALPPGLLYYRFTFRGAHSVVGRTRTTAQAIDGYRIAVMSCQHYEEGYFVAHRALIQDQPDLVLHVGDYVYGRAGSLPIVRTQAVHDPRDLADYRLLYDQYRRDPDLQQLHAAAPLVAVWDDHEVAQNDAGTTVEPRRASAYQAWWEQQAAPLEPPDPSGGTLIHRRIDVEGLARVWMLDGRQYRSDQACERLDLLPAHERCDVVDDPERTMLGTEQEAWLDAGLVDDGVWDLIGQQTVLTDMSISIGGVTGINNDQWDGYAAARERLVESASKTPRSLVLSGDIHAAMLNQVGPLDEPRLIELVAPSATTRMDRTLAAGLGLALLAHRNVRVFEPAVHGYLLLDMSSSQITVTLRNVDPNDSESSVSTVGRWLITPGSRVPVDA